MQFQNNNQQSFRMVMRLAICLGGLFVGLEAAGGQELSPTGENDRMVKMQASHDDTIRSTHGISRRLLKNRAEAPSKTSSTSQEDLATLITKIRNVQYRPPSVTSAPALADH
jgi:hypothetical protein